jgi:hypothetical protein
MTPQQYDRIRKLPWFWPDKGLHNYLWKLQPAAMTVIASYLKDWADWRYNNKPKPKPFLQIYGGTRLGKTEYLARGIVRYFNLKFSSAEYVYWPEYIVDQLNGGQMKINWKAQLLVLDDLDHGNRPVPKSMDTWLVERIATFLKPRGSMAYCSPTLIVTNREPKELGIYLATNSGGISSENTLAAAEQVMSIIKRYRHSLVHIEPIDKKYYQLSEERWTKAAVQTNDLAPFVDILPEAQRKDVTF